GAQWLPVLAWIGVVVVGVLVAFLFQGSARERRPLTLAGQSALPTEELEQGQMTALTDPAVVWSDLTPVFTSPWPLPGHRWLPGDGEAAPNEEEEREEAEEPEGEALTETEFEGDQLDLEESEPAEPAAEEVEPASAPDNSAVEEPAALEAHEASAASEIPEASEPTEPAEADEPAGEHSEASFVTRPRPRSG